MPLGARPGVLSWLDLCPLGWWGWPSFLFGAKAAGENGKLKAGTLALTVCSSALSLAALDGVGVVGMGNPPEA